MLTNSKVMVHEERERDLSNLFALLNGIPRALDPVVSEFEAHVREHGERGGGGGRGEGLRLLIEFCLCRFEYARKTGQSKELQCSLPPPPPPPPLSLSLPPSLSVLVSKNLLAVFSSTFPESQCERVHLVCAWSSSQVPLYDT